MKTVPNNGIGAGRSPKQYKKSSYYVIMTLKVVLITKARYKAMVIQRHDKLES